MMRSAWKPVIWMGSSREDIRAFPKDAKSRIGRELLQVQLGLAPSDWKPMKAVGAGVAEIRVHTRVEHRIMYIARFEEAIYVLHAFEKKTQKTSQTDIEIAKRRLAILQKRRAPH